MSTETRVKNETPDIVGEVEPILCESYVLVEYQKAEDAEKVLDEYQRRKTTFNYSGFNFGLPHLTRKPQQNPINLREIAVPKNKFNDFKRISKEVLEE